MDNKKGRRGWIGKVLLWTFFLSLFFNGVSQSLMERVGLVGSLGILLFIIATGVVFDIIGVAATAAKMGPLNAQGAKKVAGAKQAIKLASNSQRVASFCNDVVGDICGIISGSAAAAIVFSVPFKTFSQRYIITVAMALVASATVGFKGLGKTIAIKRSTEILMIVGKAINFGQKLYPVRIRARQRKEG